MQAYQQLEAAFRQLAHLKHVAAIAHWDEAVIVFPPGGGSARAEALADLRVIQHQLLVDPKIRQWLNEAKNTPLTSPWHAANLFWMENQYLQASCLPADLVQRAELAFIRCEQAWRTLARKTTGEIFYHCCPETWRWSGKSRK